MGGLGGGWGGVGWGGNDVCVCDMLVHVALVLFFIPESIAKGSSGKSFEHLHFDT